MKALLLGESIEQISRSHSSPWLFKPNANQEKLMQRDSDYSYKVYVLKHKESLFCRTEETLERFDTNMTNEY